MYRRLGNNVSRHPIPWIIFWIVTAAVSIAVSPSYLEVWQDGEFAFLPEDSLSLRAERLFRAAFPEELDEEEVGTTVQQNPLGSSIVIVLHRDHRPEGLSGEDEAFLQNVLLPHLEELQRTTPRDYELRDTFTPVVLPENEQVIKGITTLFDDRIGPLLTSPDRKATLVILELKTEFLDRQNGLILARVERLLNDSTIQQKKPLGLSMSLSGSATVGRDMLRAERISASRTENFTKGLVIVLLLIIYRAPLLAMIPLVTVGIAVELSQALLRILAGWKVIGIFTGLEVYVTVVVYGAGVDYCLFLIARYKEELDAGATYREAMARSIHRVGAALATSAGTSIVGIAMMGFSEFGKFRQAGFAISFGLFVVLCFALTFTPAFLLMCGKWAFWPEVRRDEVVTKSGWLPTSSLWSLFREQRLLERIWDWTAYGLARRPGTIFAVALLLMSPLAAIGVIYQDDLSYGLLTDLPQDEPSVLGAKAVQRYFPAGVTGPVSIFIHFDKDVLQRVYDGDDLTDVTTAERLSREITANLIGFEGIREEEHSEVESEEKTPSLVRPEQERIGVVDIRSQAEPLGIMPDAQRYLRSLRTVRDRALKRSFAHKTYTSIRGPLAGEVMRIDLVLKDDPFSRESIAKLSQAEDLVREAIPLLEDLPADQQDDLRESAEILSLGTTSGIRDLKSVTDRDRIVIDIMVVISVYIVIVIMLRRPEICAYLIVSVVFSYLVSLGATHLVFYLRDPEGFTGIDWKIPVYLFTILIAMGEDYNILLMARVTEEQEQHGLVGGVLEALKKTGSIISSCGIIMAGTFCSLMSGTLLGMVQLGFALAFGVMLDTFIVRPILVPAYLILLYSGRFGRLGRFLGAPPNV